MCLKTNKIVKASFATDVQQLSLFHLMSIDDCQKILDYSLHYLTCVLFPSEEFI